MQRIELQSSLFLHSMFSEHLTPGSVPTPHPPSRRIYLYFVVVVALVWSNDPESYSGGSVATGRVLYVRQVEGDDPDKTVLQVGVWGVRLTTSHP